MAGGSWSPARFAAMAEEGLSLGNGNAWGLHLKMHPEGWTFAGVRCKLFIAWEEIWNTYSV